jgi:hypothetical protein
MSVCSQCGAPAESLSLTCDFCGFTFKKSKPVEYSIFIKRFSEKIISLKGKISNDDEYEKAVPKICALIDGLYVPNEKSSLIELATFVRGQSFSTRETISYIDSKSVPILGAWIGKANEIMSRIELVGGDDAQLRRAVNMLNEVENLRSVTEKYRHATIKFLLAAWAIIGMVYMTVYILSD